MPTAIDIEWAAWSQAVAAFLALSVGPQALRVGWERLSTRFTVISTPTKIKARRGSEEWTLVVHNRSKKMRSFEARVYPSARGNMMGFARVESVEDGGLSGVSAISDGGALTLKVDHFGRDRDLIVLLKFGGEDYLVVHSEITGVRSRLNLAGFRGRLIRNGLLPTSHVRLMMLLMNFYVVFVLLIGYLIFLGVEHQLRR